LIESLPRPGYMWLGAAGVRPGVARVRSVAARGVTCCV
jgi:hypothetical protein